MILLYADKGVYQRKGGTYRIRQFTDEEAEKALASGFWFKHPCEIGANVVEDEKQPVAETQPATEEPIKRRGRPRKVW